MSACLSVSIYQRGSHWTDFCEFCIGVFYEHLPRHSKCGCNQALHEAAYDSILQLHNQWKGKPLFNFCGNYSYANARQCYFIRTFSVLFYFVFSCCSVQAEGLAMTQFSYEYHEILLYVKRTRFIKAENRFFLYRDMLRHSYNSDRQPNRNRVPMDVCIDFPSFFPHPLTLSSEKGGS
jgi:hypothetical protein